MKTLIISMTCGEGHNQIAKGIKAELDNRGEDNKIIQLYGYSEKEVKKQNKLFLFASKRIPHIYGSIWHRLRKRPVDKPSSIVNGAINQCKDYILKEIQDYNPDNIICVHTNAGAVVNYLKKQGYLKDIKTYGIVFDYCLCPYWEFSRGLDYVILPADFMTSEIKERGFKDEQILSFGLPVDPKYTKKLDKIEARKELGLGEDDFVIVLYSGGNCLSGAYKLIKQLEKCKHNIQIVAICGRNKTEFKKIEKYIQKKHVNNIRLEGFCTKLDLYYSASDLVFTRGGGMGLTEQINKNIPFVLREKLIINEDINKKTFADLGLGLAMDKISQAPKIVEDLINNPDKLNNMSKKANEIAKPNSTKDLVDFLLMTDKKSN